MSASNDNIPPNARLRRPKPARTEPRRNILGAFMQNGERQDDPAPAQTGLDYHPLGLQPDADETPPPHLTSGRNQEDIHAASAVIDKHISEGKQYEIPIEDGMWSRLSSLSGGLDPADLADMAKLLTRSYSELASVWVEIAGKLRETINSNTQKEHGSATGFTAPALFIQSARKLNGKIHMFAAGTPNTVQPLMPEEVSAAALTQVSVEEGQIAVFVPENVMPGRYHGLILADGGAPLGAVTVTVPSSEKNAP